MVALFATVHVELNGSRGGLRGPTAMFDVKSTRQKVSRMCLTQRSVGNDVKGKGILKPVRQAD